jgi:hypothetical protein
MLSIKTRKKYLKALGFYDGKVNSKWDKECEKAVLKLQKKYFRNKKEHDSKYGEKTDILLRSAYNCRGLKYFKLEEFECRCGRCTGYPAVLNRTFVKKLDTKLRPKYGAMRITSGLRCKKHNAEIGGIANSEHLRGKAADWDCKESRKGSKERTAIVKFCLKYFAYSYANTPGMGNSVHVNI